MKMPPGAIYPIAQEAVMFSPRNVLPVTFIPESLGTAIGDYAANGGLAAAFTSTPGENKTSTNSAAKTTSASGYGNTVGKNWARPVSVFCARLLGPTNNYLIGGGSSAYTAKLEGSNNGTDWTDLSGDKMYSNLTAYAETVLFATTLAPYLQHRVNLQGNGTNTMYLAYLAFYGCY